MPPARKPFPFGAYSWLTWAGSNAECCRENSAFQLPHRNVWGCSSGNILLNPAGSQGSREHAPDGQHTLQKRSSGCIGLLLVCDKNKAFLVMVDFIQSTLSFSRLLSVPLSIPPHQATQHPQQYSFLFSGWSFLLFVLCLLQGKVRLLSREAGANSISPTNSISPISLS